MIGRNAKEETQNKGGKRNEKTIIGYAALRGNGGVAADRGGCG